MAADKPFEELLEDLDEAVRRLENPQTSLEDALAVYEAAVNTLRECLRRLSEANGKVEMLVRESDELLKSAPFKPGELAASARPAAGADDEDHEGDAVDDDEDVENL